jgi:hypothetical protein
MSVFALADWLSLAIPVAGAIVVALIAAGTAHRRLERQLTEESERHRKSLTAEGERQDARLAHERRLADLADLRALLDEAAVALHRADYARADMKVAVMQYGRELDVHAPNAREILHERGRALDALAARLAIRLAFNDRVVREFEGANEALLTMVRRAGYLAEIGHYRPDEVRQEIMAASDAFEESMRRFHRAAVASAGTDPHI